MGIKIKYTDEGVTEIRDIPLYEANVLRCFSDAKNLIKLACKLFAKKATQADVDTLNDLEIDRERYPQMRGEFELIKYASMDEPSIHLKTPIGADIYVDTTGIDVFFNRPSLSCAKSMLDYLCAEHRHPSADMRKAYIITLQAECKHQAKMIEKIGF